MSSWNPNPRGPFRRIGAAVVVSLLLGACGGASTGITDAGSIEVRLPPAAVAIAHTSVDLVRTLRYSAPTAARVYAYVMLAAGQAYFAVDTETGRDAAAVDAAADMMARFSSKEYVADAFDVLRRTYRADERAADGLIDDLLAREQADEYDLTLRTTHSVGGGEWSWEPTGLTRMAFQHPGFADLPTFSRSAGECDIPAPDLDVVEAEGRRMLAELDLEKAVSSRVIAWLGGPGSPTPSGLWLLLGVTVAANADLDPATTTRLLTAIAVAEHDAAVGAWREKREHDLARPETMWRRWTGTETVLPRETPPHPSYPSGHSTFSGAAASVIRGIHGDTPLALTLQEEIGRPAETYTYPNLDAAVEDVNTSRVLAGFHYPHDTVMGTRLGTCIGDGVVADIDTLLGDGR